MADLAVVADEVTEPEKPWPRVVKLKHPISSAGDTITELTFRRGRLGDLKGIRLDDVPPADQTMVIASRMCGRELRVIESLDADDAQEVLAIALGFFARCLESGKTA